MARDFNGTTGYLTNSNAPVTAMPLTIAAWFYPDSVTGQHIIAGVGKSSVNTDMWVIRTNGSALNALSESTTGNGQASISTVSTGVWQHACGVFKSSTSRIAYLNGTASTTNTVSSSPSGINLTRIGVRPKLTLTDYFDGRIQEVGIWNVALDAAEIAALAKNYSPKHIRPTALKFYCKIIGRDSPEIDEWGGLQMTVTGTASVIQHERMIYKQAAK